MFFAERQEYQLASLEEQLPDQPLALFENWIKEAKFRAIPEPNAFVLCTADAAGKPHSRVVLMKSFSDTGIVFFTNYESAKGRQMAENPQVALHFFWYELERQVRIEGRAEKLPRDVSEAYFKERPRESQLAAWASPQSSAIANRKELLGQYNDHSIEFAAQKDIPCPAFWGGYLVRPHYLEFWQGRPHRLHDRIAYTLEDSVWVKNHLAP